MQNPLSTQATLTKLNVDDAASIANLEGMCFSMPWSLEQCHLAFKQKHFFAFGLKQKADKCLMGYLSFYQVLDEVEILNIAILPKFRRLGFGKYLLENTLKAAVKMGMCKAVLEVRPSNAAAIVLYEGVGFKCVGKRPKYYTDTAEDALIYNLLL